MNPDYKFFVIGRDNRIWAGNEYREDAKEALLDLPSAGEPYKIYSRTGLERKGIDPDFRGNWAGSFDGIGAPSRVHRGVVEDDLPVLREAITQAREAHHDGDCPTAGRRIDQAWRLLGRIEAHNASVDVDANMDWQSSSLGNQHRLLRGLDDLFEKTCVRKKPTRR